MGPAFITAIGYIDPGNFATNIRAGASFGYSLLWVVVWANVMAMLIQLLSAKLGIATGKNRRAYSRSLSAAGGVGLLGAGGDHRHGDRSGRVYRRGDRLQAAARRFPVAGRGADRHRHLLILMLQKRGQKPLELVIGGLLLFVAAAYIVELAFSQPQLAPLLKGMALPDLPNGDAVFLAAGVLGATIMPHVIYLHSSLTQVGGEHDKAERYAATKVDVAVAMTIAGFVNGDDDGHRRRVSFQRPQRHRRSRRGLSDAATAARASCRHGVWPEPVAAGLSSTVVGTLAGQVVMQGFVHFHIPLWLRRAVTMLPSFIVIMLGMDATRILVLSGAAQLRHCAGAGAAAGFHRQSGADGEMVNGPVVQNRAS